MELLLKLVVISFITILFYGCAVLGIDSPNFKDGTWSSCTYTDKDGRKITPPPVQLGGAPMQWTEPDGTGVKCSPIPKAPMSEPAPALKSGPALVPDALGLGFHYLTP